MRKIAFLIIASAVILSCVGVASAAATDKTGQALTEGVRICLNNSQTDYVAMIGKEKINVYEYKFFLSNIAASIEQAVGVNSNDKAAKKSFWSGNLENTNAQEYAKEQALAKVADFKIQLLKAKESGIVLDKSDSDKVAAYINNIIANFSSRDAAEKAVNDTYGVSFAQLKGLYEQSMLIDKFIAAEKGNIKPDSSQLKTYYDANMEVADKKTTVQHILISTVDSETGNPLSDEEIAKKKELADDILTQVNSGTDFNTLVQKYSDDTGSKNSGGMYTFGKGEMVKEFEDWAFSAKSGDTGMVKTVYGFHIMKKPLCEEIETTVKEGYLVQTYQNMISEWKKDKKYAVVKNNTVYSKVTIL